MFFYVVDENYVGLLFALIKEMEMKKESLYERKCK